MLVPLKYNVRSLAQRAFRTGATLTGVAAVVAVYVVMTSVSVSMREAFGVTGDPDQVLVQQAGSLGIELSLLPRSAATLVRTFPQVASGPDGTPLVSEELYLSSTAQGPRGTRNITVRGVTPQAFDVYRNLVVDGQRPGPGRRAVVGKNLARKLGVAPGGSFTAEGTTWTVVGVLSAGGAIYEQEAWMDLDELGGVARRTDLSHLLVRVRSEAEVSAFTDAANANRQQPMMALSAKAAYGKAAAMSLWMAGLGRFIAFIIALGAIFGGMNTMFAAVAGRTREVGVLRVLGFGRGAILLSFLAESTVLGLAGGALGCVLGFVLARLPLDVAFLGGGDVDIAAPSVVSGMVLAAAVGVLGGLLPSLSAARVKLADALR